MRWSKACQLQRKAQRKKSQSKVEYASWVTTVDHVIFERIDMGFRYAAPFDRHDWVVDRCGTRMRYIIDFYTGHNAGSKEDISFYLDVRPALDSWEGIKMRLHRYWRP